MSTFTKVVEQLEKSRQSESQRKRENNIMKFIKKIIYSYIFSDYLLLKLVEMSWFLKLNRIGCYGGPFWLNQARLPLAVLSPNILSKGVETGPTATQFGLACVQTMHRLPEAC